MQTHFIDKITLRSRRNHIKNDIVVLLTLLMTIGCTTLRGSDDLPTPNPIPTATRVPGDGQSVSSGTITSPESALIDVRERNELRVGVLYNAPPFSYLADDGSIRGYEVDLARKIGEIWGVDVTFTQVTRQTRQDMLDSGLVDMLGGKIPHRRETSAEIELSETIFMSGYVLLVRAASNVDEVGDLGGRSVAITDPLIEPLLVSLPTPALVERFASLEDAASALLTREDIAALIGRREDMIRLSLELQDTVLIDDFVLQEPYVYAFRDGDTSLRDLVNLTLQQLASEGETGRILSENFSANTSDVFTSFPGEPAFTYQTFPIVEAVRESVVDRIKRGEALRVAGLDLAADPVVFDSQPIVDGFNRAVVNEIARRWNVPVQELSGTKGEAGLTALSTNQADIVLGIRADRSFIGKYAVSQPYYTRALRMFYLDINAYNGIGDFFVRTFLAIDPVEISQDLIEKNNQSAQVRVIENREEAFEILTTSGVSAVVGDEMTAVLMTQADNTIEIYQTRYRLTPYVMLLSVNDPDFQNLVNFTIQDMTEDGTLLRLQEQYFRAYLPEDTALESLEIEIWPGDGSYLGVGG